MAGRSCMSVQSPMRTGVRSTQEWAFAAMRAPLKIVECPTLRLIPDRGLALVDGVAADSLVEAVDVDRLDPGAVLLEEGPPGPGAGGVLVGAVVVGVGVDLEPAVGRVAGVGDV